MIINLPTSIVPSRKWLKTVGNRWMEVANQQCSTVILSLSPSHIHYLPNDFVFSVLFSIYVSPVAIMCLFASVCVPNSLPFFSYIHGAPQIKMIQHQQKMKIQNQKKKRRQIQHTQAHTTHTEHKPHTGIINKKKTFSINFLSSALAKFRLVYFPFRFHLFLSAVPVFFSKRVCGWCISVHFDSIVHGVLSAHFHLNCGIVSASLSCLSYNIPNDSQPPYPTGSSRKSFHFFFWLFSVKSSTSTTTQ